MKLDTDYIRRIEKECGELRDRLEKSEMIKEGALVLINIMRKKYCLMREESDDWHYWERVAEVDSIMKFTYKDNTGPLENGYKKDYDKVRKQCDKEHFSKESDIEKEVERIFLEIQKQIREVSHT
jgi:hypothetical protein